MKQKDIGVYAIYRKSDDKCLYVGQSKQLKRRLMYQQYKYKFNTTEHYHKILETFDYYDKENQLNREAYWIDVLNPELNIIRDRHQPQEQRKRHSEIMETIMTDDYKQNISSKLQGRTPWNKGKNNCYSDETIQKISNTLQGRTSWNKNKTLSSEHISNIKKSLKGKPAWNKGQKGVYCWVNKNNECKKILREQIDVYISEGWERGRTNKTNNLK